MASGEMGNGCCELLPQLVQGCASDPRLCDSFPDELDLLIIGLGKWTLVSASLE